MPLLDKGGKITGEISFMARMGESALAPMYLDERLASGYVIVCAGDGGEHSFLSPRLGPSIECPKCGRTALSASLLDAYYQREERLLGIGSASIERASRSSALKP